MFPSIVECRVELDFTSTRRVFQPWMSPSTRTPRAFRVELLERLMLPFTFVWTNVHVAPVGTGMLTSTVVIPWVPRQVRASAFAGAAPPSHPRAAWLGRAAIRGRTRFILGCLWWGVWATP